MKRTFASASELMSATLLCTHLKIKPMGQGVSAHNAPGLAVHGHIMHVNVQDLQSAIEHRRVLHFDWKESMVRVCPYGCLKGLLTLVCAPDARADSCSSSLASHQPAAMVNPLTNSTLFAPTNPLCVSQLTACSPTYPTPPSHATSQL